MGSKRILGSCGRGLLHCIIMTYSSWSNLNLTYYVGKFTGLFPFAGNHKNLSFYYSLLVWISYGFTCVIITIGVHNYANTIPSTQILLKWVNYFIDYVSYLC